MGDGVQGRGSVALHGGWQSLLCCSSGGGEKDPGEEGSITHPQEQR